MSDQHETTIDFYYTNPYLEKLMNYPKKKTNELSLTLITKKSKPVESQQQSAVKIVDKS
jgi:hypothetical protein